MPPDAVREGPEGRVPGDVIEAGSEDAGRDTFSEGEITLPTQALAKVLREQGQDEMAAALEGTEYEPTFFEAAKSRFIRGADNILSIAVVAVPGIGGLWLLYQGIRLAIPAARDWPSLGIKYKKQETLTNGGARIRRVA